ncbi:MAG: tetratricopeptide repeat protein [Chloroflexi bacterium]|nr:tetratricopeptide repeat protein [Chloroflexota bacterium]
MESLPIILTKLHPPLVRRNVVPRPPLVSLVRQCAERRLTLVYSAPGYGKTTLIASALEDAGLPLVWYSLSRSDRDIVTFFSYLTEAFERQWPGFAESVKPTFAPSENARVYPAAFVAACINRLAAMRPAHDFIVVLDDFQLVDQCSEICETLDQLIAHAPPRAHFVIATRSAPPFSALPKLRACGEVLEIGEAELKFGPQEAAVLLQQCLNLQLPESRLAALVEQTEGWALGLLLAGQSIRGGGSADEAASLPRSPDQRILFEYLTEEVLRQHPPTVIDFLTSSALLSRLEPTVCDAALARSDSAQRLRELERHGLFVMRTEDGWLRYHRLFREFLLQYLDNDPDRKEALHRRAAAYFEGQQDFETAIFHWLEAGAHREAAQLIAALSNEILRAGRFDTLGFWLGRLPDAVLSEFPELHFRRGQMCEGRGQWDQALEHYERAAQAYTERGDLLGLSDVLRSKGHILDWRKGKHAEAEQLHREALGYVGEEHRRKRAALLASLARDQLSAGNTRAAQALYREALAIYEAEADRPGQLATLLNPGSWLYHSLGDFTQALAVLRRSEQLAHELNSVRDLAETYNDMAVNLHFLGRSDESLKFAEKALALSAELNDKHNEAYALMNQANAFEASCAGDYPALYQQYQRALHIEQALGNRRFVIATLVFMIMFARRGGHVSDAIRRGQQALALASERGLRWLMGFALVQLGAAQLWTDLAAAHGSLTESLQIFGDSQDLYHLTSAHFWLAALYHSENNAAYLDHLRECLRLAVSNNYDCFFRSEAQAAIPLLVSALEADLWTSYVTPILAAFGARAAGSLRPLLAHSDPAVRQRAQAVIDEAGLSAAPTPPRPTGTGRLRSTTIPPLTIRGFGNFAVWRGSHLIEEREWGRRKCKRLLKYIALSPDRTLAKDIAIDLLWADADPQAANANFYRTLYNLRRVLEPLSPHTGANYVTLEGGLLRLVSETVLNSDVSEFARGVEEGRRLMRAGDRHAARDRLAAAIALYTDDLSTDDLYDDWVRPRREQLRDLYLSTLRALTELSTETGQMDMALNYLRQAFRKDNASEAACLNLMLALASAGRRSEALQHYAACEKALAELDLAPSAELRAMQRELLAVRQPLADPAA